MQNIPWLRLAPLLFAWCVSMMAGVSFLWQAFHAQGWPNKRGRLWRFLNEMRLRVLVAAGLGLILWVLSGIIWAISHWI